jgi:hypothetical protein
MLPVPCRVLKGPPHDSQSENGETGRALGLPNCLVVIAGQPQHFCYVEARLTLEKRRLHSIGQREYLRSRGANLLELALAGSDLGGHLTAQHLGAGIVASASVGGLPSPGPGFVITAEAVYSA